MLKSHLTIAVFTCAVLVLSSCNKTTYDAVYPTLSDGKYDSEFPYRNCSDQLEEIARSLVKIDVLVFYETYSYSRSSKVTIQQINLSGKAENLADGSDVQTESHGGTAIALEAGPGHLAYLTCAHIVNYPDTVIQYYPYPDDSYVQAIGIKARQQNRVSHSPAGGELQILAKDKRSDIAIMGKKLETSSNQTNNTFSYPIGNSEELDWGSFVYIMGYPLGHAMITRGIVSNPGRISKGSFLIDAVFNVGFSGGPVIAVRDGVPNFEMVGMVKSSAAVNKFYLIPENTDKPDELNMSEPYEGKLKIQSEKEIQYGITFSITTAALIDFYRKNKESIKRRGFDLDWFFEPTAN
ncbi:MAG: serine protease [Bacteroidales bacterium]|jgi:hypothetical protein|nr:serine protease [Bacteroidales bacterium]